MAYTQEFEAAEDGIVEQPRIISGAVIEMCIRDRTVTNRVRA